MSALSNVSLKGNLFQRTQSRERTKLLGFNHAVLLVLTAFAVMPLLILAFNSVKTNAEIGLNPLGRAAKYRPR